MTLVNRVVQDCTGSPETDECHHCLHSDALQNMPVDVVPQLVSEHRFNLVIGIILQQRVGQDDATGRTESRQRRIRLLALF